MFGKQYKLLTASILLLWLSVGAAHDELTGSHIEESKAGSTGLHTFGDASFAEYLSRRNTEKDLPDLEYWGVRGAEWGMTPDQLAKPASQVWLGMEFTPEYVYERDSKGLVMIRWVIEGRVAKDLKPDELQNTRADRLQKYRRVNEELIRNYMSPTHAIRPDSNAAEPSLDMYVLGVVDSYEVEWRGEGTTVALEIADSGLVVEFRRAGSWTKGT